MVALLSCEILMKIPDISPFHALRACSQAPPLGPLRHAPLGSARQRATAETYTAVLLACGFHEAHTYSRPTYCRPVTHH
jgi:hypothetical protein